MGGGLGLLGLGVLGRVGGSCRLQFLVCAPLVMCGRCILLWWWPTRNGSVRGGYAEEPVI